MIIILNENTENEVTYEVDNVRERLISNVLSASKTFAYDGVIPVIPTTDNYFQSIKIMNGDIEMPLQNAYDTIEDITIMEQSNDNKYNVSYTFTYRGVNE